MERDAYPSISCLLNRGFFSMNYGYPEKTRMQIPIRVSHLTYIRFSISIITGILYCVFVPAAFAQSLPDSLTLKTPSASVVFQHDTIISWMVLSSLPRYDKNIRSEIENVHWCPAPNQVACDFLIPRSIRTRTTILFRKSVHDALLHDSITRAAKELEEKPKNAILTAQNGKVIVKQAEQAGFQVDTAKTTEAVRATLLTSDFNTLTVDAAGNLIAPDIAGSDIERLGITHLIAEGTTNFAQSPKNRIFNINRALQQFQGVIIAPGEEFSFVRHLGNVDGENGYLPELVIKHNRTEPEFGGGICQVSTTVFRTAIYAGLKITERRNHAYPVSYYRPYGMDATIYIPSPDLKFINNTPGHIFLQPSVQGTRLTFQMYGTNDGRTVRVDGPHILESNPDGSMRTVFTQEVNDVNGQNFIRDSFRSAYKSPALFPHPNEEIFREKPQNWSKRQWAEYQATHAQ